MSEAKTTTDHAKIKQWVEERDGHPARVKGTNKKGTAGVLVIDYPGYEERKPLKPSPGRNSFRVLKSTAGTKATQNNVLKDETVSPSHQSNP